MKNDDDNILQSFGDTIRSLRKKRNISQEELAHLSNLDRSYIGGVERGERNISLINIVKISNALNISLSHLFSKINLKS
jgi:transcriptional regulator with XRE-family HTH domain